MSALPMPLAATGAQAGPDTSERALERLRAGLAEQLERLLDEVRTPPGTEATIRPWLGLIRAEDPAPALAPEALEEVLRSLTVAYLARFAYAGERPYRWRPGAPVDLEMIDRGGAIVIRAVQTAAAAVALGLHGRTGAALLRRVRAAEEALLRSIAVEIGRAA